jgi:hypothetical protein
MKKLILLTAIVLSTLISKAQETFFPTKEGMVLTYKTFDKKDKLSSEVKYTVKNVNNNGNEMDITYLCESLDNKEKLIFKEEITIHQKGDILYLDMGNFINKAAFQQNGEIPAEVEVKGNNMQIPLNPQPGQSLPDASVEMAMKMGFVNMRVAADITNRKVEGMEEVSVAAGNFNCYKFTSDVNSVALGIKIKSKLSEWYAKGIGTVKSETYDKNGKLESRTELVELKN